VCIDGKDKPLYVSIISKCLNLNNWGIPVGANWKYILRDTSHVIHVACLIYVTLNLYFGLFLLLFCILHEIVKQCCNIDMDQLSFCIFPTKHGPQMEQKQTRVLNNRVLWTYHITQIWRDSCQLLHFTCVNLNYPEIFFPYYYSRNDTLLHSTCFSSISHIPRCILSQ